MNKNILFLITLYCAVNVIAGPKTKEQSQKAKKPAPTETSTPPENSNPTQLIVETPKSPLKSATIATAKGQPAQGAVEESIPLTAPQNHPLIIAMPAENRVISDADSAPKTHEQTQLSNSARNSPVTPTKALVVPFTTNIQSSIQRSTPTDWEETSLPSSDEAEAIGRSDDPEVPSVLSSIRNPVTYLTDLWDHTVTKNFLFQKYGARWQLVDYETTFVTIIQAHQFKEFLKKLNADSTRRGFRWLDLAMSETRTKRQQAIKNGDTFTKKQHEEHLELLINAANTTKLSDILTQEEIADPTFQDRTLLASMPQDVLEQNAAVIAAIQEQIAKRSKRRLIEAMAEMSRLNQLNAAILKRSAPKKTSIDITVEAEKTMATITAFVYSSTPSN